MKAAKARLLISYLVIGVLLGISGCGKQPEKQEYKDMRQVVRSGNTPEVVRLLAAGANIHAKDQNGRTLLHLAALYGRCAEIELLIQNGAKVDAKGKGGQTPLFATALAGNKDAAESLIANGANVNAKDNLQSTALHRAVKLNNFVSLFMSKDRIDFVELLFAHGADVNARDGSKYTPLHCAIAWGWCNSPEYEKIVQALLAKGADANAKDRYGRTPLKLANGNQTIVDLLLQYGAKE